MRALAFLHPAATAARRQDCLAVFYVISDNLILMKKTTITVTDAARNFADCVNRAHYQNTTFVLLKNGTPFARLVPDNEKVSLGMAPPGSLAKPEFRMGEPGAGHHAFQAARKTLKPEAAKCR